ncbi:MAG: GHKL domain-containing protein, partial [Bacteroidetes bacterium]|nr:GHKL domain-containing protein [Bacteroidota bacterium]
TQNLKEAQEMARIGSWVVDVHTNEMKWSDEVYRIYGMEMGDPTFAGLRSRYSTEDAEILTELYNRAVKFHEPYEITLRIIVNDEVKYIDAQAKPVFEEGELSKIVGTVMDVTDRYIAQRKLEISNIELEKKVAERTKDLEGFSYSVSHDLRAPLRSILGFSNILVETYGEKLDEEGQRLLEIISRNADKMSTLIEELLTFSRVGVTVPNFQPIKLDELLKTTWHEAISSFQQKDKVSVKMEKLPTIYGATSLLNQVFSNLFSNALKYSSKKEKIVISVKKFKEDTESVTLVVEDNGCGFNMKYHEKLFGVFQRLHSEDEFPGTGVGLALVKRIVDKHHGSIWAESEIDKGSKFFISLPLTNPNTLAI